MSGLSRPQEGDPFSFFSPVVSIDPTERDRIDRGEVVVRILPARDGEVAVFAASRFEAEPEALVRWTKAIEALKRSPFVVSIRRFSHPPVLSDLDALVLDDVDLDGIPRVGRVHVSRRPGHPPNRPRTKPRNLLGAERVDDPP